MYIPSTRRVSIDGGKINIFDWLFPLLGIFLTAVLITTFVLSVYSTTNVINLKGKVNDLESLADQSVQSCDGSTPTNNQILLFNETMNCWLPQDLNLLDTNVRIDGYNATNGSVVQPIVITTNPNTEYSIPYQSPLVFNSEISPNPPPESSVWLEANNTFIEDQLNLLYLWRIQFLVDRVGTGDHEVRVIMRNPITNFEQATSIPTVINADFIYSVNFFTYSTISSVPPSFGGQGIGYTFTFSTTSGQIDRVIVQYILRSSFATFSSLPLNLMSLQI